MEIAILLLVIGIGYVGYRVKKSRDRKKHENDTNTGGVPKIPPTHRN